MKKKNSDWFFENWKEILFVLFFLFVAIPAFIYHLATIDPKLKSTDSRNQLKDKLEKEMKEISLPSKTAVNKFQSNSKDYSILVSSRYRTELAQQEFINQVSQELIKKGWISYHSRNADENDFCRENQRASLNYEGQGGLFGDSGNYYNLDFSVGLVNDFKDQRPSNCW